MGQDLDPDDDDFEGPESVLIEMNFLHGVERGIIDIGAKSFWVDKTWFLGVGGTIMKYCGPGRGEEKFA
jgi:hypothetical protein